MIDVVIEGEPLPRPGVGKAGPKIGLHKKFEANAPQGIAGNFQPLYIDARHAVFRLDMDGQFDGAFAREHAAANLAQFREIDEGGAGGDVITQGKAEIADTLRRVNFCFFAHPGLQFGGGE